MFNVHRFNIDNNDDRDGGEANQGSSKLQQKEKILSDLLERARSRATKRPRVAKGEGTSEESSPNNVHDRTVLASPPRLRPFASVETAKEPTFAGADPDGKRSQRLKGGRRLVARRRDALPPRDAGYAKAREAAETEQADNEGKQDGWGRQGEEGGEDANEGPDVAESAGNVEVEADARRLQGSNRKPVEEVAEQWGLDARLTATLSEEGLKHFFPIQIQVIPDIVATERHSHVQSRDICVCAPTGSGKTLVFVLGVLQALIRRRVIRLRALVLLPSRDLAVQVHRVFQRYARGTGLRVGLAIGQTNFLEEQLALVGAAALAGNPVATARATCLHVQDGHASSDQKDDLRFGRIGRGVTARVPSGGSSQVNFCNMEAQVDVVVATPGRLLDHLEKTSGFTLQHLRYLVIDEADRLFNQSYHGWVGKVIQAAYRREPGIATPLYYSGGFTGESEGVVRGEDLLPEGLRLEPVTVRGRPLATGDRVRGPTVSTPPLRKLLFSATLTSNPQKLAGLDVVNPIVYTAREAMVPLSGGGVVPDDGEGGSEDGARVGCKKREAGLLSQETRRSNLDHAGATGDEGEGWFSTPATLVETYTVCEAQAKPLVLIALLRDAIKRREGLSVVFTSSVDSTHRLFRLLQLFGVGRVYHYSMYNIQPEYGNDEPAADASTCISQPGFTSDGVLERGSDVRVPRGEGDEDEDDPDDGGSVAEFSSSLGQRQRSRIIRRARAGDIQVIVCSDGMARGMDLEGVGLVVNYDVPSHAKTYVHRVGRTARAGARGRAVTIAKKGQVKRFRLMREGVDGRRVRPEPSPPDESNLEALAGRYRRCLRELGEVLEAERAEELDPTAPVDAMNAE